MGGSPKPAVPAGLRWRGGWDRSIDRCALGYLVGERKRTSQRKKGGSGAEEGERAINCGGGGKQSKLEWVVARRRDLNWRCGDRGEERTREVSRTCCDQWVSSVCLRAIGPEERHPTAKKRDTKRSLRSPTNGTHCMPANATCPPCESLGPG